MQFVNPSYLSSLITPSRIWTGAFVGGAAATVAASLYLFPGISERNELSARIDDIESTLAPITREIDSLVEPYVAPWQDLNVEGALGDLGTPDGIVLYCASPAMAGDHDRSSGQEICDGIDGSVARLSELSPESHALSSDIAELRSDRTNILRYQISFSVGGFAVGVSSLIFSTLFGIIAIGDGVRRGDGVKKIAGGYVGDMVHNWPS